MSYDAMIDDAVARLERDHVGAPCPALPPGFAATLSSLLALVARWNSVHDLTAAREPGLLVDLYLADAWMVTTLERSLCSPAPDRAPGSLVDPVAPWGGAADWLDVGSGGGAPGLVLALLNPGLRLTLAEPRRKRAAFLRSAIGELGLVASTRVTVTRSEALPSQSCDIAISRAALEPNRWLEQGIRLARRRVWVLETDQQSQGHAPESRVLQAGWQELAGCSYRWPLTGKARAVRCVGGLR